VHSWGVARTDPLALLLQRYARSGDAAAMEELVRRTRQLISGCTCPNGCPACVGPIVGDLPEIELELSRKQIALDILDTLEAVATH